MALEKMFIRWIQLKRESYTELNSYFPLNCILQLCTHPTIRVCSNNKKYRHPPPPLPQDSDFVWVCLLLNGKYVDPYNADGAGRKFHAWTQLHFIYLHNKMHINVFEIYGRTFFLLLAMFIVMSQFTGVLDTFTVGTSSFEWSVCMLDWLTSIKWYEHRTFRNDGTAECIKQEQRQYIFFLAEGDFNAPGQYGKCLPNGFHAWYVSARALYN